MFVVGERGNRGGVCVASSGRWLCEDGVASG